MFKQRVKQAITVLLALVLIVGGTALNPTPAAAAGEDISAKHAYYAILPGQTLTVEFVKPEKKNCTSIHIPDTVRINGQDYKVVSIRAGAFKNCKELIKVSIGKNVKTIGKKAFYGCKNLRKLSVFSKKLTNKTVAKDAFKGISKKGWAVVPEKKVNSYKKLVGSCGASVKKWDFYYVSKDMMDNITTWDNYVPGDPLPDSEFTVCGFYGDPNNKEISKSTNTTRIPLYVKTRPDARMFGEWEKEWIYESVYHCNVCGRNFDRVMGGVHITMMNCNYWYTAALDMPYQGWVFYPDDSPLKITFAFTLPDGLVYKEGTMKLWNKYYTSAPLDIQVSGNTVTATIENVKIPPLYYQVNQEGYDKDPDHYIENYDKPIQEVTDGHEFTGIAPAIPVGFDVAFGDNPQTDNPINVSVIYEYKGMTKTIDMGTLMVHYKTFKYVVQ